MRQWIITGSTLKQNWFNFSSFLGATVRKAWHPWFKGSINSRPGQTYLIYTMFCTNIEPFSILVLERAIFRRWRVICVVMAAGDGGDRGLLCLCWLRRGLRSVVDGFLFVFADDSWKLTLALPSGLNAHYVDNVRHSGGGFPDNSCSSDAFSRLKWQSVSLMTWSQFLWEHWCYCSDITVVMARWHQCWHFSITLRSDITDVTAL